MTDTGNAARIVFGNINNGIQNEQGYNAEFEAADFEKFKSIDAISGRHGAVDISKLMYERHSQTILLKPIITMESMVEDEGYTTDVGDPEGAFEIATMAGQPVLDMIHQYKTTAKRWKVKKAWADGNGFYAQEGFMVYWYKLLTTSGSDPNIEIKLYDSSEGEDYEHIKISIQPRKKIVLSRTYNGTTQTMETTLPESFYETETEGRMKMLACMFIDEYIIIGMNGFQDTIAMKCKEYTTAEDSTGEEVVLSAPAGSDLEFTADGACYVGMKILTFETEGGFATPIQFPGYKMTSSPIFEFTKYTKIGASGRIRAEAWAGGDDTDSEDTGATGKDGIEQTGVYAVVQFETTGWTPLALYSFRIYSVPTTVNQSTTALNLNSDIRNYREESAGDKDGNFMGTSIRTQVRCHLSAGEISHSQLYRSKAPQARQYLTLRGGTEELRSLGIINAKEISRPKWNRFELNLTTEDISKVLRTIPVLVSENYDKRGWTHVELMQELASKAGVTLYTAPTSDDTTIPPEYHYLQPSGDTEKPNWQFNRGTMIWDAMQRVREFSGWLLSPNFDNGRAGELYYRPKPTADDTAKYSFNADSDKVTNVRYRSANLYRTRIMIFGIAARASAEVIDGDYDTKAWRYKKDDIICGMGIDNELERELGRSIPLVWIDPTFSDWRSIGVALLRLYNYYTAEHITPVFQINDFENYQDLHPYDLISWTDDTEDYAGDKIINGKYLVTSMSVNVDRFSSIATLNSAPPEKSLVKGLLQKAKEEREAGRRDYNDIVKGMEAVTKGDYQRMLQEAPAALRVFAYNDETVDDWNQVL